MERILEPELMDGWEQAEAYANADFEEPHSRVIEMFDEEFPATEIAGAILDLGCGPGDITFRFAHRFPRATITAVDGSAAMIELGNRRKQREPEVADRIMFIEGFIPGAALPRVQYELIISTSFLHHLPDPAVLWESVIDYASPGTKVFVYDLFRPQSREEARRLVEHYSGNEPEVLKQDFYLSLLAAFEPEEVEEQLAAAGLAGLSVKVVSDRHLIVFGEKTQQCR